MLRLDADSAAVGTQRGFAPTGSVATASKDQARQTGADDGAGDASGSARDSVVETVPSSAAHRRSRSAGRDHLTQHGSKRCYCGRFVGRVAG